MAGHQLAAHTVDEGPEAQQPAEAVRAVRLPSPGAAATLSLPDRVQCVVPGRGEVHEDLPTMSRQVPVGGKHGLRRQPWMNAHV